MDFLRQINRKIILPIRQAAAIACRVPYYYLRTHPLYTSHLCAQGAALNARAHITIPKSGDLLLRNLTQDGLGTTTLAELCGQKHRLDVLQQYARELLATAHAGRKKTFLAFGWPEDKQPVSPDNPFVQLVLDPLLLSIVATYLGTAARFTFMSLNKTMPVESHADKQGSQKWHRDPGFGRKCKLFLYLNNVDNTAGPFTYVRGSHLSGQYGTLFPNKLFGKYGSYPPEDALLRALPKDAITLATGPAGSLILCDTLGIHRGGFATIKERIMFTAQYEAPSSFDRCTLTLTNPTALEHTFPHPLSRFALGLPSS